jgi:predicted N-acetyltransferase YhbS
MIRPGLRPSGSYKEIDLDMVSIFEQQQIVEPDKTQIMKLLLDSFGRKNIPTSYIQYYMKYYENVVGYTAISKRQIAVGNIEYNLALLGFVCTSKANRGKGYGRLLLEYIIKKLANSEFDGIILNCGLGIVDFYKKVAFSVISNRARYIRNGVIETDYDPVMYYGLKVKDVGFDDVIYFGTDF